jgi:hypothetical protein
MKSLILLALLVVLAACTSLGVEPLDSHGSADSSRNTFNNYIIVGDSIMDMSVEGESTTTASLILLEENKSVTNISLAGQTMTGVGGEGGAEKDGVSGAINFLTSRGRYPQSTAVIIELAHNDWYFSVSADAIFESYTGFLKAIDTGPSVSLFCVVPIAAKWDYLGSKNANGMTYEELRNVVRKVAATGLCNPVETTAWFTREDVGNPLIMPDGLHLAAGGHRIYKDQLIEALKKSSLPIGPAGS